MSKFLSIGIFLFRLALAAPSWSNGESRNEVGFLLGGTVTPRLPVTGPAPGAIDFGSGKTFQATYARYLAKTPLARLSLEIPLLAAPSISTASQLRFIPSEYASLFITPGLRLTLLSNAPLAPWFSFGGGYARFKEAEQRLDGSANTGRIGRNTGALQFGGGVDIASPLQIPAPISFRLELRDIYSGKPNYAAFTGSGLQHNLVLSGGFAVHF